MANVSSPSKAPVDDDDDVVVENATTPAALAAADHDDANNAANNVSSMIMTIITHEHCDVDAHPAETTKASDLTTNVFHKICPGAHHRESSSGDHVPLGMPRCGDGSNYSFLYHRPPPPPTAVVDDIAIVPVIFGDDDGEEVVVVEEEEEVRDGGGERIIIELAGGGACWDEITCTMQSFLLTYPSFAIDPLIGTSCSDVYDGYGKMLCDRQVGDNIDFSTYNFVLLPYCTQDAHMGDVSNSTSYGVLHVGGHNLYRTINWILDNFPNPIEVILTGCSAGATPLTVAYELIESHYRDNVGQHDTKIIVIGDSPGLLTPSYFVRNALPNWNVGTLLDMIGFDIDDFLEHDESENLHDAVLDHALNGSKITDDFLMITHDADETSMFYYRMMNGTSIEDASMPDPTMVDEWWAMMNDSITLAKDRYDNFDAFVMEGSEHCTFGLNVALEYAGFEEWLSSTLADDGGSSSVQSSPTNSPTAAVPRAPEASSGSHPSKSPSSADEVGNNATTSNAAARQSSSGFAIAATIVFALRLLSPRSL